MIINFLMNMGKKKRKYNASVYEYKNRQNGDA